MLQKAISRLWLSDPHLSPSIGYGFIHVGSADSQKSDVALRTTDATARPTRTLRRRLDVAQLAAHTSLDQFGLLEYSPGTIQGCSRLGEDAAGS